MKIFNKYECCRGITLFSFGRYRAEIWFIPANYKIVEHSHPEENVELMFIFGRTKFFRRCLRTGRVDWLNTKWNMIGRCFTVKCSDSHWFETNEWPLVFINFQSFLKPENKKSACEDFKIS